MGFEVPVSDVGRTPGRGGRAVAAALAVSAAIVALAVATSGSSPPGRDGAAATGRSPNAGGPSLAVRPVPRDVPSGLRCGQLDRPTCLRMARAAMLALPDDAPAAIDATVWRSLLCNDTFDCPPMYLEGSVPLGSVIVGFADGGPRAAVNVVEGRGGPIHRAPRAWVVSWMPETG